jgi:D-alanyl-lipoteichoic acid acyltransferase DltB (MBOAT superfamily)
VEPYLAVFAFFLTFFLIGVWHGQTPEFLFYGFLLGLGVSVNKTYQLAMVSLLGRKRFAAVSSKPFYVAVARGLTFTYVCATIVWFWSSWKQIAEMRALLGMGLILAILAAIFAGATIVLAIWEALRSRVVDRPVADPTVDAAWRAAWNTAQIVIILVITMFLNQAAPDIVYKAF